MWKERWFLSMLMFSGKPLAKLQPPHTFAFLHSTSGNNFSANSRADAEESRLLIDISSDLSLRIFSDEIALAGLSCAPTGEASDCCSSW